MAKSKPTPFFSWETTKPNGIEKRYIRMGDTQMLHPAMLSLSHSAFRVYAYMKIESGGHKEFEYPYSKFKKIISKQGFQSALAELVEKGFIKVTQKNKNLRIPNKYAFSDDWKDFGVEYKSPFS